MIETLSVSQIEHRPADEPDFVEMLPVIYRVAGFAFRHLRRAVRQDCVAEVVGHAFEAYQRLVARGKRELAYASPLAWYGVRRVRAGRIVGVNQNANDVMSALAPRKGGFSIESLSQRNDRGDWEELAVDRKATPAAIAICRMDFRAWLSRLQRFKRRVALSLASGVTTAAAAKQFEVSCARVSQLRRELAESWQSFQAVPAGIRDPL